ncbi:MAG: hypothetical protein ABUK06_02585 [Dehalococcoidales bacterium]
MDIGLTIEETHDMCEIMAVLKHPVIYDTITSDSCPSLDDFDFDVTYQEFLAGKVNGEIMALMIFYPDSPGWYCHVQVVPEYRCHAMDFGKKGLKWFFETHKEDVLWAEIPEKYPNVAKFAKKHGFEKDKTLDGLYIKDGIPYNQIRYKLERERWAL